MKLTIKTLQQLTFKLDIEPEKTVKELKETIEREQGKDYPISAQKLIYDGKILIDDNKLEHYNFDEKKFIVLMIIRPPPQPKSTEPASSTAAKSKPTPDEKLPKSTATTAQQTPTTPTTNTTTTAAPRGTSSAQHQQSSNTASRNQPTQPTPTNPQPNMFEAAGLPIGESQVAARLASLMSQPQFREIQDLIQQSPHLLSSTIESLAASDPELHNFISVNPDLFVSALNQPPLPANRSPITGSIRTSQQQQQQSANRGEVQEPIVNQVLLDASEHDKEAIERLKELGFSEFLAVQAYMACDKDEQLAANLLLQMDQ